MNGLSMKINRLVTLFLAMGIVGLHFSSAAMQSGPLTDYLHNLLQAKVITDAEKTALEVAKCPTDVGAFEVVDTWKKENPAGIIDEEVAKSIVEQISKPARFEYIPARRSEDAVSVSKKGYAEYIKDIANSAISSVANKTTGGLEYVGKSMYGGLVALSDKVSDTYDAAEWQVQDTLARANQWVQNQKYGLETTKNNAIQSVQLIKASGQQAVHNSVAYAKEKTVNGVQASKQALSAGVQTLQNGAQAVAQDVQHSGFAEGLSEGYKAAKRAYGYSEFKTRVARAHFKDAAYHAFENTKNRLQARGQSANNVINYIEEKTRGRARDAVRDAATGTVQVAKQYMSAAGQAVGETVSPMLEAVSQGTSDAFGTLEENTRGPVRDKCMQIIRDGYNYAEEKTRGPKRNKMVRTAKKTVRSAGQFLAAHNPFKAEEPVQAAQPPVALGIGEQNLRLDDLFEPEENYNLDVLFEQEQPNQIPDVQKQENNSQVPAVDNEQINSHKPTIDLPPVPPVPDVIKKPTVAYYILGGTLLTAGAALVYKAIDYLRLNGLHSNIKILDELIAAASAKSYSNSIDQLYKHSEPGLTLVTEQDKKLLQLYVDEPTKLVEAATKIKHELSLKYKNGFFSRISSGIKHDIKRVQGWSERALSAIKAKLARVFKGIK